MRVVLARPLATEPDLPSAELLAEASALGARFPELRPCALARMPEADARAGARVWLALESMQVTGSFKARGALLALSKLAVGGASAVVAASAGNHGAGVAYAAKLLGLEATVVVPKDAPEAKRARIAGEGARLVVSGSSGYDGAEMEARALAARLGAPFVSPYDDVAVVAGNGGSLGWEIAKALGRAPAVVLAPFGGGGLATGLACALPETKVFGAQSEASPAFALSIERGSAIESLEPTAPTLADGLEGGISSAAFCRASAVVAGVLVVSEDAIASAMSAAQRSLGLVLEGSAAAALAPLLEGLPQALRPASNDSDLVAVLTGRNRAPAAA